MIGFRFRNFSQYVGVLAESKNCEHVLRLAQFYYVNLMSKCFSSITVASSHPPKTGAKNISTASEMKIDDPDLFLRSQNYMCNHSHYLRNLLYPKNDDEVIAKLKCCATCDTVLDTIKETANPKPEHLVQALLVLRDLCRVDYLYEKDTNDVLRKESLFSQFIEQIIDCTAQLTAEELSCCVLYCYMLGVDKSKLIPLITAFEVRIKEMEWDSISVSSLSRVCLCVKDFGNIWAKYTFLSFLPILSKKLDSCEEINEFCRLTVCFKRMTSLLSCSLMEKYVEKCFTLIPTKKDPIAEFDRLRTVVKCVSFLNYKRWGGEYFKLSVDLLLSLQGRTHFLGAEDQYVIYSILYDLHEPHQLLRELKSIIQQKISPELQDTTLDLRSTALLYMHHGSKDVTTDEWVSSMSTYVDSVEMSNESQFYRTWHFLSLMDKGMKLKESFTEKYWNHIINFVDGRDCSEISSMVFDACIRYVKFNTRLKHRHRVFESKAVLWLNKIQRDRKIYQNPAQKCILDVLLLYYDFERADCAESIREYFLENVSRLEPDEAGLTTFVLRQTADRIFRSKKSSSFFRYYVQVLSAFHDASIQFLKTNKNVKTDDLLHLFRCYSFGNNFKCAELYRLFVDRLNEKSVEDLSSRRILALVPACFRSHSFEPSIADKMVQYIISRKDVVSAYTASRLMNYVASFGYTPSRCNEFVETIGDIIIREKDELAIHELVRVILSLCYYNHLPRELSNHVFSVDFLSSVDEAESAMTNVRSRRFQENFMQLNRAVCLDFPNIDAPWFHDRYCHAQIITSDFNLRTELQKDIEEALTKLVCNKKALDVGCRSPYYHKMDFILYTNKKGEPVDPNNFRDRPQDLRKVAILVNTLKMSSPYYLGKIEMDMTVRQLEKLEYKVAVIEGYLWNSMFMSEPTAKETYLCDIIWSG